MKTKTSPQPQKTNFALSLVRAAGFESLDVAADSFKDYKRKSQNATKNAGDRSTKIKSGKELRRISLMLYGLWAAKELHEGRLVPELQACSYLGDFCKMIGLHNVGSTSQLPSALPFPVKELEDAKIFVDLSELVSFVPKPTKSAAKINTDTKTTAPWLHPKFVHYVDLRGMSEEKRSNDADKAAQAIKKFFQRKEIGELVLLSDYSGVDIGQDGVNLWQEYLANITKVSPKLADSFLLLTHAFLSGQGSSSPTVTSEEFFHYYQKIPILPPDELRFILRDKIQWVTQNEH